MKDEYQLLDSGDAQKLERFGEFTLLRPCPQAVWRPQHGAFKSDAAFSREGKSRWTFDKKLPASWVVSLGGVSFKLSLTDFGHLGVFPEHSFLWESMRPLLEKGMKVLNLFAYSGGMTLAAAQEGAEVCHLDASKGMVDWARENGKLNGLEKAPIRWIVDDAIKFLRREIKRGTRYEGIILDPPTFGRGAKGEVFKIESEFVPLLELCRELLSERPRFVFLSCHTPGFTPLVLEHLMSQVFHQKSDTGEMSLSSPGALSVPSGSFAKVIYD